MHTHRRELLRWGCAAGAAWLGRAASALEKRTLAGSPREPAQAIILLWLAGGSSQLDTFDPHPESRSAANPKAIRSAAAGVELAEGYERLAEQMERIALVRTLAGKEGDHERGAYHLKTGFRPAPALVYPTLGAAVAHQLPANDVEIPRHVSLLPSEWPGWGGYLGGTYDAFQVRELPHGPAERSASADDVLRNAPARRSPLPDVDSRVDQERTQRRMNHLQLLERSFSLDRADVASRTGRPATMQAAQSMMTSEKLAAFDVDLEPLSVRERYGATPFGRACLAARRLVEVGVRCVEATFDGLDSHADNRRICRQLAGTLDPAFSALVEDLAERGMLERTVVLCGGEFGRTPRLNALEGRDHWPHNFCFALAGRRIAGGRALGETDPDGRPVSAEKTYSPADLHATALAALGINPATELVDPNGRPLKLSEGRPIEALFA